MRDGLKKLLISTTILRPARSAAMGRSAPQVSIELDTLVLNREWVRRDGPAISRIRPHLPHLPGAQIKLLLLLQIQGPSTNAAEDTDLIAALVHGAIAVKPLGNRHGMAAVRDLVGGDHLRRRPGAKAIVAPCL